MASLPLAGLKPASLATAHSTIAGLGIHLPVQAPEAEVRTSEPDGVVHRITGDRGATTPWLAAGAARAALQASGLRPSEIQLVVVGTTSPDVLWPSTACLVQTELGLGMVPSFDLYAAEAGLLTAVAVADRFVRSGTPAALVIGAESDRQLVDLPRQSGMGHGRAASAVVLARTEGQDGILASIAGGAAGPDRSSHSAIADVEAAVHACLSAAGIRLADCGLVIGEQTAPEVTRAWAAAAGIEKERLLLDPARYRIAFAAAPLIALHDAVADGRVQPGTIVLLLSCGTGPAWAATCLRWGKGKIAQW